MRRKFLAGQMPVKADWSMLRPTKAVEQEPVGRNEIAEREGQQDQQAGQGENGAIDGHLELLRIMNGAGTLPRKRPKWLGRPAVRLHLTFEEA